MNESNIFTKLDPILIYGGGSLGKAICSNLLEEGYDVTAIIDRDPDNVTEAKAPVISPQGAFLQYGNINVIIALANGIQHLSVAYTLLDKGFDKLLLLPLYLRSFAAKQMIRCYEGVVFGENFDSFPSIEALFEVKTEDFIMDSIGSYVRVVIPQQKVFSTLKRNVDITPLHKMYPQADIVYPTLPIALYRIDHYSTEDSLFQGRSEQLEYLQNAMMDMEVFNQNNAIVVEYNQKDNVFNILDGGYRACYLTMYGRNFSIPVWMLRTEFEQYFRQESAHKLMRYCFNNRLTALPIKVPHPAFSLFSINASINDKELYRLCEDLL